LPQLPIQYVVRKILALSWSCFIVFLTHVEHHVAQLSPVNPELSPQMSPQLHPITDARFLKTVAHLFLSAALG
jgi:hypothetical protein